MSTATATSSSLAKVQERIAKWENRVAEEEAEVARLNEQMPKYGMRNNPRGRQTKRYRDQAESRLSTARMRLREAQQTLEALTPPARMVTVPEFTVRTAVGVTVTVPETAVELRWLASFHEVYIHQGEHEHCVGAIIREGDGWTASYGVTGERTTGSPHFHGDHFPRRTGKHTQTYALAWLVAVACGFTSDAATYGLKYEGVSA